MELHHLCPPKSIGQDKSHDQPERQGRKDGSPAPSAPWNWQAFNKGQSTLLQRASEVSIGSPEPETQLAVGPKYESY